MAGASEEAVAIAISAVDHATSEIKKVAFELLSLREAYMMVKEGIEEAVQSEEAEMRLYSMLRKTSDALSEQAEEMAKVTRYRDDDIVMAQSSIAMFTRNEQSIHDLTKASADLASAFGWDLNSAAFILSKTLDSNVNILGRYGMQVDGAAGSSERLASILSAVQARAGGMAEAMNNTFSAHFNAMGKEFSEVLKQVGEAFVRNKAVIAGLEEATKVFAKLRGYAGDNKAALRELAKDGILFLVDAIKVAVYAVGGLQMGWEMAKVGMTQIISWLVDGFKWLFDTMNETVLWPVNQLMDALVELGAISKNPLQSIKEGLEEVSSFEHDALNATIVHREEIAKKYAAVLDGIDQVRDRIANTPAEETRVDDTALPKQTEQALTIRGEYMTAYYQAQLELTKTAMGEEYATTAEYQAASDTVFYDSLQQKWEALQANKANSLEMEVQYQTMLMQIQSRSNQQALTNQKMAAAAGKEVLSGSIEFTRMMYQKGGAHAHAYFAAFKALAITETLIAADAAAMKVFNALAWLGPEVAMPAAIAVEMFGIAKANNIRTMEMDSSAMPTTTGANIPTSTGFGSTPAGQEPARIGSDGSISGGASITLKVEAPFGKDYSKEDWERIAELYIAPAVNANSRRGVQIITA